MKRTILKWTAILGLTLLAHIGIFNLITDLESSTTLESAETLESECINLDILNVTDPIVSTPATASVSEPKEDFDEEKSLQQKAEENQRIAKLKEEKAKAEADAKAEAELAKLAAELKERQQLEVQKKAEEKAKVEKVLAKAKTERLAKALKEEKAAKAAKAAKEKATRLQQEKAKQAYAAKLKAQRATQQALAKKIVSPAHAIKKTNPIYPRKLERKRTEGTVKLKLVISATGATKSITISKSSGHKDFDNSALKAIKTWRYQAAKNALGNSVESSIIETFIFRKS